MTTAIELFKRMEAEWKASGRITWPAYEIEVRTLLKYSDHGGFEHTLQKLISDVADIQNAMYRLGFMAAPPAIKITHSDPPAVSVRDYRVERAEFYVPDGYRAKDQPAGDDAVAEADLAAERLKPKQHHNECLFCGTRFSAMYDKCPVCAARAEADALRAERDALKARKVKLPATPMHYFGTDGRRCRLEAIMECTDAIRAAGVEVES